MHGLAGTVRQMLLYTLWADRICLAAVAAVEEVRPEDLTRPTGTSFGSLLGTLAHMQYSQRYWLDRLIGKPEDPAEAPPSEAPAWPALTASWSEVAAEMEFFLAALSDEQMAGERSFLTEQGVGVDRPLWQLVLHLVNHATYHRGQVVSLLRQLGYPPPSTDLIRFFGEHAA